MNAAKNSDYNSKNKELGQIIEDFYSFDHNKGQRRLGLIILSGILNLLVVITLLITAGSNFWSIFSVISVSLLSILMIYLVVKRNTNFRFVTYVMIVFGIITTIILVMDISSYWLIFLVYNAVMGLIFIDIEVLSTKQQQYNSRSYKGYGYDYSEVTKKE